MCGEWPITWELTSCSKRRTMSSRTHYVLHRTGRSVNRDQILMLRSMDPQWKLNEIPRAVGQESKSCLQGVDYMLGVRNYHYRNFALKQPRKMKLEVNGWYFFFTNWTMVLNRYSNECLEYWLPVVLDYVIIVMLLFFFSF